VQPNSPFISINTITAHSVKNTTIATNVVEATTREYIVYSAIEKSEAIPRISNEKIRRGRIERNSPFKCGKKMLPK